MIMTGKRKINRYINICTGSGVFKGKLRIYFSTRGKERWREDGETDRLKDAETDRLTLGSPGHRLGVQ